MTDLLQSKHFSGYTIRPVEISTTDEFCELFTDCVLPEFVWLDVTGQPFETDFGISKDLTLVVSQSGFNLLKQLNLGYCEIKEIRK